MSVSRSDSAILISIGGLIAAVAVVAVFFVPSSADARATLSREEILATLPEDVVAFAIDVGGAYEASSVTDDAGLVSAFEIADERVLSGDPAVVLGGEVDRTLHSLVSAQPAVRIAFDYNPGSGWGSVSVRGAQAGYPRAYNQEGVPLNIETGTGHGGAGASVSVSGDPQDVGTVLIVLGPPSRSEPCRPDRQALGQPC